MRRIVSLDYHRDRNAAIPVDAALEKMAVEYCEKNLVDKVDLSSYARVWIEVSVGADEKFEAVTGILGFLQRPDVWIRSDGPDTIARLAQRANAFFSDNGLRGFDVLIYVDPEEDPSQKCKDIQTTLAAFAARPANRWAVTVK